jgi:hypothetical protein
VTDNQSNGAGGRLPAGFDDLERFVDDWALPTEKARFERRLSASLDEVRHFNDTMHPRMHEIIGYLNGYPLDGLPDDATTLLALARSYMETSHPVDLGWRSTDLEDAFDSDRFTMREPSC